MNCNKRRKKLSSSQRLQVSGDHLPQAERSRIKQLLYGTFTLCRAAVPVPAGPPLSSASSPGRCSVPAPCSVPAAREPRPCPPRVPLSAPRAASYTLVYKTRNTALGFYIRVYFVCKIHNESSVLFFFVYTPHLEMCTSLTTSVRFLFQSLGARTSRLKDSFIHQAVGKLNSLPVLPSRLLPSTCTISVL